MDSTTSTITEAYSMDSAANTSIESYTMDSAASTITETYSIDSIADTLAKYIERVWKIIFATRSKIVEKYFSAL